MREVEAMALAVLAAALGFDPGLAHLWSTPRSALTLSCAHGHTEAGEFIFK